MSAINPAIRCAAYSTALPLTYQYLKATVPWINADYEEAKIDDGLVIPLKSVEIGVVKLNMYVEESQRKAVQ